MAAPIASKVTLPDDSGNSGKKIRTQTRVVGSDTVHEHFFQQVRQAQVLGVYRLGMAQVTALASAQNGTSSGFLWFHVPTAITNKKARIRRLSVTSQLATLLATPTAPRLTATRFTFSGTASGASLTPIKIDASGTAAVSDLRTAVTGLTVALVGSLGTAPFPGAQTAVGAYAPAEYNIIDPASEEDEWPIFAPGEGFVIYQDTAGTASDTRVANITLLFDEIDVS